MGGTFEQRQAVRRGAACSRFQLAAGGREKKGSLSAPLDATDG
jgi:hypothetical protein